MIENIICKNCGKELPAESTFCPYCMTKFTSENVTDTKLRKKSVKIIPIIVVAVIIVIAVLAAVWLLKDKAPGMPIETETTKQTETLVESTSSKESETKEEPKVISDNEIGFSLYSDMKKLSGEKGLVADYFGSAFMTVSYESLKEDVYINSKIKFNGIVIEKTEDYLVVEYGASVGFDGIYEPSGNIVTVILPDITNIDVSDSLVFYGEYRGMKNITINDEKINVPQFSATRYTEYIYVDVEMPLYTKSEITTIAKNIFGKDTVVRDAMNSDFENGTDDVEVNSGMYYTAIAGDSKYCFYTGESRYIYDCGSTFQKETYILPTADISGYYRLTSFTSENKNTVERIDAKGVKCWQREFKLSDLPVIDYTTKNIYIVSDAMLYIIDTETGEDSIIPKYIGEKCDMKKTEDGIVLLSYDGIRALMKTDLSGNVMWTASLPYDLSDSVSGENIPCFQKTDKNFIICSEAFNDNGFSDGIYISVISDGGEIVFNEKQCD